MNERKTKKEIVESICNDYSFDKNTVSELYSIIFNKVKEELCEGNTVMVMDFGLFELKYRKGKNVRNPKNGEMLSYDSHYNVSFKPGKELKEKLGQL